MFSTLEMYLSMIPIITNNVSGFSLNF